jgi:hypothetical protein
VILIMAALGIMSVLRWMQRCQGSASLFDFLHQQRGEHRAPLLGDSEPAGNVAFDQPPDHRGGDRRARDACWLPFGTAGNAEQQKARGDADAWACAAVVSGLGCGGSEPLFVGFSDDRGLIFICFGLTVFIILLIVVIVVVWISRRHDKDPEVDQTGGNALRGACGHARAPVNVATFTLHRNAVGAAWERCRRHCGAPPITRDRLVFLAALVNLIDHAERRFGHNS